MVRIQELVGAMALLSNSWTRMQSGWAKVLVVDTPFFEPNFVSPFACIGTRLTLPRSPIR